MDGTMKNQQRITALIKSVSGQANILTIPRIYISLLCGKIEAALLLSQCVYWSDRTTKPQGWFYKSYKEWEDEIGLSQFRVKNAANELKELGILETKLKRANRAPTIHYRVNISLLTDAIIKFIDNQETAQSDYEETQQTDYQETPQTLTETTTETTTEIVEEGPPSLSKIAIAYENNIAFITAMTAETIREWEANYPEDWTLDAIRIANANKARSDNYITAILERWKKEGRNSPRPDKDNGRAPAKRVSALDKLLKEYEENGD